MKPSHNPAKELHSLFEKWTAGTGQPAFQVRGLASVGSESSNAAFDEHIRAMRLIAECETAISELEASGTKVNTYRKTLRLWAAGIMHFPFNWQHPGEAVSPFDDRVMDTLDTLAIVLDSRLPLVTSGGMEHLRRLLTEVRELLAEDESLSAAMREHVLSVVQTLMRYLDDVEMYGKADIQAAVRDLWVGLNAAAGQTSDRLRPKWQSFVQQIGVPAAGTILGSIPTLALEAAALVAGG
jgi:hypothetical protein